jgi:hypothetical protein
MKEPKPTLRVYTVVDVFRGCAQEARSFVRYTDARTHFRKLRKGRNLDIDDVQLFEDTIELPAKLAAPKSRVSRPLVKSPH